MNDYYRRRFLRCSVLVAMTRLALLQHFRSIFFGKLIGGIPCNIVPSLEGAAGDSRFADCLIGMQLISHAEVVRYAFPESFPPLFRREKAFDRKYVYELKNVFVSPASGMTWTPTNLIFAESVGSLWRMLGWGMVLHELLLKPDAQKISGPMICCPDTGYFHWLLEILPNVLDALQLYPQAEILIPTITNKYVREGLELILGKEGAGDKLVTHAKPCLCEHYIMPACGPFSGFVQPRCIVLLREALQKNANIPENRPEFKVYISRRHAPKRAPANEDELEIALKTKNYEVLHLEEMTFPDQISVLSRATTIVSLHGAGLSNMIWTRSPCSVTEIFPVGAYNDCYARLALTCDFPYAMFRCLPNPNSEYGTIPVKEVLATLT